MTTYGVTDVGEQGPTDQTHEHIEGVCTSVGIHLTRTEAMARVGCATYDEFRVAALEQTGCSFCTRLHLGRELPGGKRHHVRIAYSGIEEDEIREGLGLLRQWISAA
jgi:hypothetical protein